MIRLSRAAFALAAGAAVASVSVLVVVAQPPAANQTAPATSPETPPGAVPAIAPPAPTPPSANVAAPHAVTSGAAPLAGAEAPPAPPPPPPVPVRSPAAILQALDKVTAETMRFAAPVGQRVRYKNLVFIVKACETSRLGQASPAASAYLVIESAPPGGPGFAAPPPKEVYHGWMYANDPELHPFQHPIYDAWLIACMAAAPKT